MHKQTLLCLRFLIVTCLLKYCPDVLQIASEILIGEISLQIIVKLVQGIFLHIDNYEDVLLGS